MPERTGIVMELHITCIPGDGIGPEIVAEAKKVLEKVASVYGHKMIFEDILSYAALMITFHLNI